MARYSAATRTTAAPTATLPGCSIYGTAACAPRIREIEVYNTTTTACVVDICYLTSAGTQGANIQETKWDPDTATGVATVVNSHTSTPPTLGNTLLRATLGAAAGAGMIWTFDNEPIRVPVGTANGVGILCLTGTGQILDFVFIWDE